jgi:hypothetical protein
MNDDHIQAIDYSSHIAPMPQPTLRHNDEAVIDQALRFVADLHASLGAELDQPKTIGSLVALRQSPLGRKLRRLSLVARGAQDIDLDRVRTEIDEVLALFMQPLVETEYRVPEWFWQTSLGEMLGLALHRTYASDQLLCLESAAERLDEQLATIERLLADGTLTAIRDETGKRWIPVKQIEHLRTVARTFDRLSSSPADSVVATRAA